MDEPGNCIALVVDDEAVSRTLVRAALEELGCREVLEAENGVAAQVILRENPGIDLVVTDIAMPELDGIGLLRWGREHIPGTVWIILSGLDTFDTAVEAIRLGAFDFLAKPPRVEEIKVSAGNALERRRLVQERDRLTSELESANSALVSKVTELEEKSELLRRDLERAEVIQRALLPKAPPPIGHYCVQAFYRPGQYVGGDLYDVRRLDDRHVALYVVDATGHGVTSAMLSVLYKQKLAMTDEQTGRPHAPARVLEEMNRSLAEADVSPGLFITGVYCLLDVEAGVITLASAGHPPVLHLREDGRSRLITRTGPALGLTADAHFEEERIELSPGDQLLLYTDGVVPANGTPREDQLRDLARRLDDATEDPQLLLAGNDPDVASADAADADDVTLLLLTARTGTSHFENLACESGNGTRTPTPSGDAVFYGETEAASFFALKGRVTWVHADAFFEASCGVMEKNRPVVVDLAECEYLDSTSLGTIHELVSEGDVHLQNVTSDVREMFDELSMTDVLDRIGEARELPEMYPLLMGGADIRSGSRRILKAHQALLSLSVGNREKFQEVVDALAKEAGGAPGA
jgi:serine phosphatase RsbU (regulator of sigma subunit)